MLAFTGSAVAQEPAGEVFESPETGLRLTPPKGWVRISAAAEPTPDARTRTGPRPLVRFARHSEPYPTLNPTIHVTVGTANAFGRGAPSDGLARVVEAVGGRSPGFAIRDAVAPDTLSEQPAARATVSYTIETEQGARLPVVSKLWLVRAGPLSFLIALDGPPDGPDYSDAEFEAVLQSVVIEAIRPKPRSDAAGAPPVRVHGGFGGPSTPVVPYQPKPSAPSETP